MVTRNEASSILREEGITSEMVDLSAVVAIGFNQYGGGLNESGFTVFYSQEAAQEFIESAPVSREVIWIM